MKKQNLIYLALSITASGAMAQELSVVGNVPARYLGKSTKGYSLAVVSIKDRIISKVTPVTSQAELDKALAGFKGKTIFANAKGSKKFDASFDMLYPGLVDLHNHTKQNNLDVWDLARGQFKNRFEWRDWDSYTYSVSANMNPWIGFGKPMECAAFRWSEIQAMVLGTTYLQGPSSCIDSFTIHQVEDAKAYKSKKAGVSAPTDLVIPNDMTYVWDVLRPMIKKGKTYEEALAADINAHCDLPNISADTVNTTALKQLKDQALLQKSCTKGTLHAKFIRYIYWVHGSIAGKKAYLKQANRSAVIAHLAEGRRDDPYNQVEFEMVQLFGLDQPNVNFVHGVGISKDEMKVMGKKGMGLIWSPFSNSILYGETLDVKSAKEAGVILALGSDWLPTGTRNVLEELKVAAAYVDKDPYKEGLPKIFTDEELYLMVTENPAKMINHSEIDIAKGEAAIGQIKEGAMGSIIAVTKNDENPYTNLVRKAFVRDINLVVVDGNPMYGNESYIKQASIKDYEVMPVYQSAINEEVKKQVISLPEGKGDEAAMAQHLVALGKYVAGMEFETTDACDFSENKAMVHQNTLDKAENAELKKYFEDTGLNLDRFVDIEKLLGISLLTQSFNRTSKEKGKVAFAVNVFPSLFACNDQDYSKRVFGFIQAGNEKDEFSMNRVPATVEKLRTEQRLGSGPKKLGAAYKK
ncbi:MAG: amidohydrolase family protein [Bacteriovoracaceae bacterium]